MEPVRIPSSELQEAVEGGAAVPVVSPEEASAGAQAEAPQADWEAEVEDAGDRVGACELLTGPAGSGKTTEIQRRIAADGNWALLTSTTGISAVNLGCGTINSTLGYFNEDSLRDLYACGRLAIKLRELQEQGYKNLLVEECSMLTAPALDMLHIAAQFSGIGIVLVGDLLQLPPIRGRWCFEADCWPKFAANTTKLTHIWRQEQVGFLAALVAARAGWGAEAAALLTQAGVEWHTSVNNEFDGTTIVAKNLEVDNHNKLALTRVKGERFTVSSSRWGKQRSEWGQRKTQKGEGWVTTAEWGIPPSLELKVGAYVMILANSGPDLEYCNGDCGHIEEWDARAQVLSVRLVRTGEVVEVGRVVRSVDTKDRPSQVEKEPTWGKPHRNARGSYVVGQVNYLPVRLAYCSTVHKTQSLTLDKVQINFRDLFFKSPGMLYVALSRVRTLEGLRLVGMAEVFARHCNTDPRVRGYL